MLRSIVAAVSFVITTTASFSFLRSTIRGRGFGKNGLTARDHGESPVADEEYAKESCDGDSVRTKPLDESVASDTDSGPSPLPGVITPPNTETIQMSSKGVVAEIIRQQQQLVQKLTQVQQELEITKTELTTNKIEVGKLKRLLDDQEESFSAKWREREAQYAKIQIQQKQASIEKADEMEMWQSELSKLRLEAIAIRDAISRVRSRSPSGRSGSSTTSTHNSKMKAKSNRIVEDEGVVSGLKDAKSDYSVGESEEMLGLDAANDKQKKGTKLAAVGKVITTDESVGSPGRPSTLKSIGNSIHTRSTSRGKNRQRQQQSSGDSLARKSFPGPSESRGRTPTRDDSLSIPEDRNSLF